MTETPCVYCKGKCCRDFTHKRFPHKAAEHYWHACAYCADGTVPAPAWTAEQECAAVVVYLRDLGGRTHGEDGLPYDAYALFRLRHAADAIERGAHRDRREEKP